MTRRVIRRWSIDTKVNISYRETDARCAESPICSERNDAGHLYESMKREDKQKATRNVMQCASEEISGKVALAVGADPHAPHWHHSRTAYFCHWRETASLHRRMRAVKCARRRFILSSAVGALKTYAHRNQANCHREGAAVSLIEMKIIRKYFRRWRVGARYLTCLIAWVWPAHSCCLLRPSGLLLFVFLRLLRKVMSQT